MTNEAAERLRAYLTGAVEGNLVSPAVTPWIDEALAAERRATVEQIREAVKRIYQEDGKLWEIELMDVLDEEAAR